MTAALNHLTSIQYDQHFECHSAVLNMSANLSIYSLGGKKKTVDKKTCRKSSESISLFSWWHSNSKKRSVYGPVIKTPYTSDLPQPWHFKTELQGWKIHNRLVKLWIFPRWIYTFNWPGYILVFVSAIHLVIMDNWKKSHGNSLVKSSGNPVK